KQLDKKNGANTESLDDLRETVEAFQSKHAKIATLPDFMYMLAIAFGITGFAHLVADNLAPWIGTNLPVLKDYSLDSKFFWMIVTATLGGLSLSFTKVRMMESVGASKVGSAFIYVLVATIGMKMNILAIFEHYELFIVGFIWMSVHASLILIVAKLIKAPTFYMAVGSQANVGGAASAPVVASAFHPSLAPVGVLLAVLGYTIGTAAAWFCGQLMRMVAPM
ncbi:MAG: putative membrane protein, partial [Enterobacterales bacterium]